jgi:replicative DNA helicase
VRDGAARRRMTAAAYRMLEIAQTAESIDDNAMAEVEKAIAEIGATVEAEAGPVLLADLLDQYWAEFEERVANRDKLIGVDTGFAKLNKWLQGWRPGYLCVVGARPGMGKTAFMLQSASRGATEDIAVLFSIEMLRNVLIDRMMSAQSMVPLFKVMNGHIDDDQRLLLTKALAELEERKVYIDDNPYATVPYIRSKLRKIARQNVGKKLVVFVDYLQIVKTEKGRSRAEEIGQVSSQLKAIAKELNCCIVALAQVNRQVDGRADKRPVLSDIRDSGQIEQDADVIMFLYRDEYYNPDTPTKGVIEVIVAKNRNGSTGTTKIGFSKEYQRFIDFPEEGDE